MRTVRFGNNPEGLIDVCPYIKINAHDTEPDDIREPGNPEYEDLVKIHCKSCGEIHELNVWIN